jgi:hypothetical protein
MSMATTRTAPNQIQGRSAVGLAVPVVHALKVRDEVSRRVTLGPA